MYDRLLFSDTTNTYDYNLKLICIILIGFIQLVKIMNNRKK